MRGLHEIWYLLMAQTKMIVPFWALGLVFGSWLSTRGLSAGSKARLGRFMRSAPVAQIVIASALGALSPVTLYGAIPVIAAFDKLGLSHDVLLSFVTTSVMINPNVFVYSLSLGYRIALLRLLLAMLAGCGAGLLSRAFSSESSVFHFDGFFSSPDMAQGLPRRFSRNLIRSIAKTSPYLIAGMLLAALFDMYFPRHLFLLLFTTNQALGVLFSAGLTVPLYYCGGGTIPLISAWIDAGMSPGQAMAFMLVGPVTRMTNLAAIKSVVPTRNSLVYLAYSVLYGVLAGIVVDTVLK